MGSELGWPALTLYLVGVTGLGMAIVAILYTSFQAGLPRFAAQFFGAPGATIRGDPGNAVLMLAGVVLVLLLVAFVVVFGAKHGPVPEHEE